MPWTAGGKPHKALRPASIEREHVLPGRLPAMLRVRTTAVGSLCGVCARAQLRDTCDLFCFKRQRRLSLRFLASLPAGPGHPGRHARLDRGRAHRAAAVPPLRAPGGRRQPAGPPARDLPLGQGAWLVRAATPCAPDIASTPCSRTNRWQRTRHALMPSMWSSKGAWLAPNDSFGDCF